MKRLADPSDERTTLSELKTLVESFVAERQWHDYHLPKNLSMSLAIEVAELMEHFQWLTPEESREAGDDPRQRREIEEELADVVCYALAMANAMGIDLSRAIALKMEKNALKYPPPPARRTTGRSREASAGAADGGSRSVGLDSAPPGGASSPE